MTDRQRKQERDAAWRLFQAPSGADYYFNIRTNEITFAKPIPNFTTEWKVCFDRTSGRELFLNLASGKREAFQPPYFMSKWQEDYGLSRPTRRQFLEGEDPESEAIAKHAFLSERNPNLLKLSTEEQKKYAKVAQTLQLPLSPSLRSRICFV